jgi:hypothetical protein
MSKSTVQAYWIDSAFDPSGYDLPDMIRCWSRYLRELRADLESARGYPDEEVPVVDLRNAEAHLAGLMAIAQAKAQAA